MSAPAGAFLLKGSPKLDFSDVLSPLWRIGFYRCQNKLRLRVNGARYISALEKRLVQVLGEAGLGIMGTFVQLYSENSTHGYTMHLSLTQSSAAIHTYPETGVVTISIETCESSETMTPVILAVEEALRLFYSAQGVKRIQCEPLPLFVEEPNVSIRKVA